MPLGYRRLGEILISEVFFTLLAILSSLVNFWRLLALSGGFKKILYYTRVREIRKAILVTLIEIDVLSILLESSAQNS